MSLLLLLIRNRFYEPCAVQSRKSTRMSITSLLMSLLPVPCPEDFSSSPTCDPLPRPGLSLSCAYFFPSIPSKVPSLRQSPMRPLTLSARSGFSRPLDEAAHLLHWRFP